MTRLGSSSVLLAFAVTALAATAERAEGQAEDSTRPATSYALVLSSSLNVREAPSLDADVVGGVPRGQRLCVRGFEGDWAEVYTPLEQRPAFEGFVSRGFISGRRATPDELREIDCL